MFKSCLLHLLNASPLRRYSIPQALVSPLVKAAMKAPTSLGLFEGQAEDILFSLFTSLEEAGSPGPSVASLSSAADAVTVFSGVSFAISVDSSSSCIQMAGFLFAGKEVAFVEIPGCLWRQVLVS